MNIDKHVALPVLEAFLKAINFLSEEEQVLSVTTPGEGNMNVVLRVTTNKRSVIAKQSRPFVQKYQDIPAPIERIGVEHAFYKTLVQTKGEVKPSNVLAYVPSIIAYSELHHLLLLEDLGAGEDLTLLYQKRAIPVPLIHQLTQLAQGIHTTPVSKTYPANTELKALNHQHIFVLPFLEDNGFSLDTIQVGLEALARPYKQNAPLKKTIETLGKRYLALGEVLIHGDYYPGSWMQRGEEVFLLDPEFSCRGFAEFDIGVMAAHVLLITGELQQLQEVFAAYSGVLDVSLAKQIAGVEVMRRLIGLAQLPLERSLEEKATLLEQAALLLKPSILM
ncbi:MAG: phosphotransferase [Aureispira sp.]